MVVKDDERNSMGAAHALRPHHEAPCLAAGAGGDLALGRAARLESLGESLSLISQNVFIKSFCQSQLPHKSVNLSFIITTS